jgi:hypothetical protein
MSDDLIEQVAKAVCKAHKMDCGLSESDADYEAAREWLEWSAEAQAAIAAMQPHIEAQREDAARRALEAAARLVAPTMNKRGPFAMVVSHAIAAIPTAQFRRPA